jgi:hypothetical protein
MGFYSLINRKMLIAGGTCPYSNNILFNATYLTRYYFILRLAVTYYFLYKNTFKQVIYFQDIKTKNVQLLPAFVIFIITGILYWYQSYITPSRY